MKQKGMKIGLWISVAVIIVSGLLYFVLNGTRKEISGEDLFPESYWEEVVEIIYRDFDESIYAVSENRNIQDIRKMLTSVEYKEIKDPELEGWYLFEIYMDDKIQILSFSSNYMKLDGQSYKVSAENLGENLSEYLRKISRSSYSEFEMDEDLFETVDNYKYHNPIVEFEREIKEINSLKDEGIEIENEFGTFEKFYYPIDLSEEYPLYEVFVAEDAIGFFFIPMSYTKGDENPVLGERNYYLFVMSKDEVGESWLFSPDGSWEYFSSIDSLCEEHKIELVKVEDLKLSSNPDCG